MTKVTNNSRARQGFNTLDGQVKLRPGESGNFNLDEDLARRIAGIRGMVVEGLPQPKELSGEQHTVESVRRLLDAVNEELATVSADLSVSKDGLEAKDSEIADLRAEIQSKNDEIDALRAEIEKLVSFSGDDGDKGGAAENVIVGLVAKHKGGGSYSVFDADDKELVSKLTKEQEIEFNGMDDAGKTQWVAIQLKNAQDDE